MQVVLASHGRLAEGMKDTLGIILGELPDLTTLCAYVDPDVTLAQQVKDVLARKVPGEEMLVVTDLFGGSVNNEMLTVLPEYPAVHLICGMNASLVLTLASNDEALTQDELAECIADAKAQIIDCNLLLKNAAQDEEDDL